MAQVRSLCFKLCPNLLLKSPNSNFFNTLNNFHINGPIAFSTHLPLVNSDALPPPYHLRRHRGGKVKNRLRNMEKKKKKEQLLNSTLDKYSVDLNSKTE